MPYISTNAEHVALLMRQGKMRVTTCDIWYYLLKLHTLLEWG